MLSLWTQRLMNIHHIQSLPFIPSIHHWLQRLDRGVLVKHCSVEPKDGCSSPRIANNLLPYLWILDNLFGKKNFAAAQYILKEAYVIAFDIPLIKVGNAWTIWVRMNSELLLIYRMWKYQYKVLRFYDLLANRRYMLPSGGFIVLIAMHAGSFKNWKRL